MSSKSAKRLFRTLRSRLTFWYAGLFTGLSSLAFLIIYLALNSTLLRAVDQEIVTELGEWDKILRSAGTEGLAVEFESEALGLGKDRVFCRLLAPDCTTILASDLQAWPRLPPPPRELFLAPRAGPDSEMLETVSLPGRSDRVRTVYEMTEDGRILQFGHSLAENARTMERYRAFFVLASVVMLLVGGGVGSMMARRAMLGIERIAAVVERVTEGDFSQRVSALGEGEEVENLARTFNHMQDRIQELIAELRDVTNNIAHDLRSPLTRIRGLAETTLTGGRSMADCQEALGGVVEETDRLIGMINTMLAIAEADSGAVDYTVHKADLAAIVSRAVELHQPVAEEGRISLTASVPDGTLQVAGDTSMLQRAVANLLDNALKYTPPGGRVTARLHRRDGQAVVEVIDAGVGIPEQDLPRVFDRFFRGDESRSTPGNGLGLSYVQAVVRAHGGHVAVASLPRQHTTFRVSLPVDAHDPGEAS